MPHNRWSAATRDEELAPFDLNRLAAESYCLVYFDDHGQIFSVRPGFFGDASDAVAWLLYYCLPGLAAEQSEQWRVQQAPALTSLRARGEDALVEGGPTCAETAELCNAFNRLFVRSPRGAVLAWGSVTEVLASDHFAAAFAEDDEEAARDPEARISQSLHNLVLDGTVDPTRADHLASARAFFARHEVYND